MKVQVQIKGKKGSCQVLFQGSKDSVAMAKSKISAALYDVEYDSCLISRSGWYTVTNDQQ